MTEPRCLINECSWVADGKDSAGTAHWSAVTLLYSSKIFDQNLVCWLPIAV